MARIALDGLGGEQVGDEIPLAIQKFLKHYKRAELSLATSKNRFEKVKEALSNEDRQRLFFLDGPERIPFDAAPVAAIKKRKNNSISVAVDAVRRQDCEAVVSFGHTGAAVVAATLQLGLLDGVSKAGLTAILPNRRHFGLLTDVGANLNSRPEHLFQYANMADLYCSEVLKIDQPKIGLLNIGSEKMKGNSKLKKTHDLFENALFDFVGNVEGGQIFDGSVDVVVCNGLEGNMILKASESLANMLFESIHKKLTEKEEWNAVNSKTRWLVSSMASRHDPDSRGACRLLGVNGLVLIGHGNAREGAIYSGLVSAYQEIDLGLQPAICERLSRLKN